MISMLLPLPEPNGSYTNPFDSDDLTNYARACVTHATAAQAAEIEALRAEVAQVRKAYENRTRDYYVQGDAYDVLRVRAERLAEVLRDARSYIDVAENPLIIAAINAALEQEADRG